MSGKRRPRDGYTRQGGGNSGCAGSKEETNLGQRCGDGKNTGEQGKSRGNGPGHSGGEGRSYSEGTGEPWQDFEQGWDMIPITVFIQSDLRGLPQWCSG